MSERILNKRYVLDSKVGEGGMAITYRAHDLLLNRTVAVKVMREQFTSDPQFVERFRREAQAAARLSHVNIAGVYDTGTDDGTYYIVMELVEGTDLKQRLRREGALPVLLVLDIGRQIAAALDAAHRGGLIHRDIKPHNILLTKDNKVKVTDFGIAKLVSDGDDTGVIIGSVHYLSPEQARGEATTPVSDLYSLGAVLFEALTGRTVYEGENPMAVAHKQNYERPPLPRTLRPDIPPAVESVVLRCLEKDPRARYQSAAELQAVLTQLIEQLSQEQTVVIPAPPVPTMDATMIYKPIVDPQSAPPPNPPQRQPMASQPAPPDPPVASGRSTGWIIFILFLVLCGVVGYGAWLMGQHVEKPVPTDTGKIMVPDLVTQGLTSGQAKELLTVRGFTDFQEGKEQSTVDAGKVCRQDPPAGSEVDPNNTKILYWISDGPSVLIIPSNIVGMSRDAAAREIRTAGFTGVFQNKTENSDTVKGMLIRTEPAMGAQIKRDAVVTLVLSLGPATVAVVKETYKPGKAPDIGESTDYIHIEFENPQGSDPQVIWEGQVAPGDEIPEQPFDRKATDRVVVRLFAGKDKDTLKQVSEDTFGPAKSLATPPKPPSVPN